MRRRTLLKLSFAAAGASALRPFGAGAANLMHGGPALPASGSKPNAAIPLHPGLQHGAAVHPNKRVRVIVQRHDGHSARTIAAHIGEPVHKEFSIIAAHAMTATQGDLLKLAAHPGVRYISPDSRAHLLGYDDPIVDLKTRYPTETNATSVWAGSKGDKGNKKGDTGNGIAVAVIDTGFADHPDLKYKELFDATGSGNTGDGYGHGTHVAGIIAGNNAKNGYVGMAPDVDLIGIKVADANGAVGASSIIAGVEWLYNNHDTKKIRAVNLSVSLSAPESYHSSPLAAAVEVLWNAGITVVAAAGNLGNVNNAMWYGPGNDPYVITVGALDDTGILGGVTGLAGEVLAPFSSYGMTQDGFAKPDVVAPGRRIVSTLAPGSVLAQRYVSRITDGNYLRLSGTSTSAPIVTGAVALLLSRYPGLTPNQVKGILTGSAASVAGLIGGAKALDIAAALTLAGTGNYGNANAGLTPSTGLGNSGPGSGSGNDSVWDDSIWDDSIWDDSIWDDSIWD